jgi:signal transduction histidine kinase/ligand-binding sensor domain-containing protein
VLTGALLACGSPTYALNPALDISQYGHRAWTIRDGFITSRVTAITQTPDGYLWLGTESGLLRFDGIRPVSWQPPMGEHLPSARITTLLVTRDGRLWIGTDAGLASWKDGTLITYPGVAGQMVDTLAEDADGTVWVGTATIPEARLCAIRAAVQCLGQDGRFGPGVFSLFPERGTVWVGAATGLWRWSANDGTRHEIPGPSRSPSGIIRTASGAMLIANGGDIQQLVDGQFHPYRIPGVDRPFHARRLFLDRDGGLWITTAGRGLVHVHGERADLFTRTDGLSGNDVYAVYEDREANVWVATEEGLDRFRELAVTTVSGQRGAGTVQTSAVLQARDGSVWLATAEGLSRRTDRGMTAYRTRDGLPNDQAGTLFEDSAGRILASTLGGLAVFGDGRFTPLRLNTRVVYNIVEDRKGSLWLNDQELGLIHAVNETIAERIPWTTFGHKDHSTALAADSARGGLWIGFYNGGVAWFKGGGMRASYGTAEGLGGGRVSQLQLGDDGTLWAATAGGLSRIAEGGRITTLTTRNGLPCDTVQWMLEDDDHAVWLLTSCGLIRIVATEFRAWRDAPGRLVAYTLFDNTEGVRTQPTALGYTPAAAKKGDGRLLWVTTDGLAVVDPRHLPADTLPPQVHIEQVTADRNVYQLVTSRGVGVRLPPGVHELHIDYTTTTLRMPEKVRFRYKLEGVDRDWQEVGTRRQAFYTDLGPRQYRFRVAAMNSSGVWSREDATVDFSVAPAYYETIWFRALAAATVVGLVWTAHRIRVRIVERHEREILALNERMMKAQEQERIRIAGELHDGVMQQMLSVTMMLGTAKRRIDDPPKAKAMIDQIQEKMVQVGSDLRQLSHGLHPPMLQEAGLPAAVRAYCDEFSAASGVQVFCECDESARELSRGAALALFRVVQEALGNAAKHARATRITVRLTRTNRMVSLVISDNGVGFDPGHVNAASGLGLIMMRERATQLNGTFEVTTTPGRGTTIEVVIPFR